MDKNFIHANWQMLQPYIVNTRYDFRLDSWEMKVKNHDTLYPKGFLNLFPTQIIKDSDFKHSYWYLSDEDKKEYDLRFGMEATTGTDHQEVIPLEKAVKEAIKKIIEPPKKLKDDFPNTSFGPFLELAPYRSTAIFEDDFQEVIKKEKELFKPLFNPGDKVRMIDNLMICGADAETPAGNIESFDLIGMQGEIITHYQDIYDVDFYGKIISINEQSLELIQRYHAPPDQRFFNQEIEDIQGIILKDQDPPVFFIE